MTDHDATIATVGRTRLATPDQLKRIRADVDRRLDAGSQTVDDGPERARSGRGGLIAAAAVLAIAVVTLALPPARALAEDAISFVLSRLFPTTSETETTIEYIDGPDRYFESAAELQRATAFDVAFWPDVPADVTSQGYEYDSARNVAVHWYDGTRQYVRIAQQPVSDAEQRGLLSFSFEFRIPESADRTEVTVGSSRGELVRGMWTRGVDADEDEPYRWNPRFGVWTVRWLDASFVYEVMVMPQGGGIRIDQFGPQAVEIANSVARAAAE